MSPTRCWPNSTRRARGGLAAALGLALLPGCALQKSQPLKPAFADPAALTRRHPGHGQLEAIGREIASLRRGAGGAVSLGFGLDAAVLEPFERPAARASRASPGGAPRGMAAAVEAEMRLVERRLRSESERRLRREAARLQAAAREAIRHEGERLDRALQQRLREIELRYRSPETTLTIRLESARRRLGLSPLAPGARTQAELERAQAESDLAALQERKRGEVEAARGETGRALEAFAAGEKERAARALAEARQRAESETARTLAQEREALERDVDQLRGAGAASADAAPGSGAHERAASVSLRVVEGASAAPAAAATPAGREVARLERLRARIASMLTQQTLAAAVLVGRRQGLEVSFERVPGRPVPDVTAQMEQWLDEYWRAGAEP